MSNDPNREFFDVDGSPKRKHRSLGRCLLHTLATVGAVISFIRNLVANLVFLLILAVIGGAWLLSSSIESNVQSMVAGDSSDPESIAPAPVLWLDLSGYLDDMPAADDRLSKLYSRLSGHLDQKQRLSLQKLTRVLVQAGHDPEVKAVVADVSALEVSSMQAVERIIEACDEFKKSAGDKKPLIFFAESFDQAAYLAASHASEIVLDPMGAVDLHGLSMNSLYFGPLLERFRLTPYVFRAGSHKSAVEPMLRDGMSPEVKEEYGKLADGLWSHMNDLALAGRPGLDVLLPPAAEYLRNLRHAGGDCAAMALKTGLVDTLMTADQLSDRLAKSYPSKDDPEYPDCIEMDDYSALQLARAPKVDSSSRIAVIYGMGEISSYSESPRAFTPDNIGYLLDQIADDERNKGVLLYIDSGGGEVTASEAIRREILRFKKTGRKVAVYMADMTASGAYWIATAADKIIASPSTVTGSIGVFAASIGADRLLNEYGVTQDGVATNELAESPIAKSMNIYQREAIDLQIGYTYQTFLNLVCASRGLDVKNRGDFAEGRVFTADSAYALGLVDSIGTFQNALDTLEAECGLKKDESVWRSYVVPVGNNLGALPQLMLKYLGSSIPDSALKSLVETLGKTKAPKDSGAPKIMAVEPSRPQL